MQIKSQWDALMLTACSVFFQLNEMIRAPVEGDFWQVDHIQPVYRGGGQCSLDNLQTLCTVCHKAVRAPVTTRNTNAKNRRAEGQKPICLTCGGVDELLLYPHIKRRAHNSRWGSNVVAVKWNMVKHIDQKSCHPSHSFILPVITSHDLAVWHSDK